MFRKAREEAIIVDAAFYTGDKNTSYVATQMNGERTYYQGTQIQSIIRYQMNTEGRITVNKDVFIDDKKVTENDPRIVNTIIPTNVKTRLDLAMDSSLLEARAVTEQQSTGLALATARP